MLTITLAFPWLKLGLSILILIALGVQVIKQRQAGLLFPIAGGGSNLLAMVSNGGVMPVKMANFVLDPTHQVMTAATHLKLLCDIIPVGQYLVLSLGDVVLFTWGLTFFIFWVYTKYKKVRDANAL